MRRSLMPAAEGHATNIKCLPCSFHDLVRNFAGEEILVSLIEIGRSDAEFVHGECSVSCAPARIPETLDQFSTDLISLDRFGSKGDIAGGRRYVRYSPRKQTSRNAGGMSAQ